MEAATETPTIAPVEVSTTQLLRAAGLTYRQVDYWCTIGVLEPVELRNPGSGFGRTFDLAEVRVAIFLAKLRHLDVPMSTLRRVASQLRLAPPELWGQVAYVTPDGWLVAKPVSLGYVIDLSLAPALEELLG